MPDFSWSHILIVLIVALVVVGPKDLPRLMRTMGRWAAKGRAMANEFRASFDQMAQQAELDELRKEMAALKAEQVSAEKEINQRFYDDVPAPAAVVHSETAPAPPAIPPGQEK